MAGETNRRALLIRHRMELTLLTPDRLEGLERTKHAGPKTILNEWKPAGPLIPPRALIGLAPTSSDRHGQLPPNV